MSKFGIISFNQTADVCISGAVSVTGVGECLLRTLAGKQIADKLNDDEGRSQDEVIKQVLDDMTQKVGGDGGGIAITPDGKIGVDWNSERMAWAYVSEDDNGKLHFGCNRGEHFVEDLPS